MTSDRPDPAAAVDLSLDVAAVRARVDAATPGPWFVREMRNSRAKVVETESYRVCENLWHDAAMYSPDAEFIAHARTDVPALLAALEVAREALEVVLPVVQYVSVGRGYARTFPDRYPDATARRANYLVTEALRALDGEQT